MPSVTFSGQSFSIDGRRFWVVGASLQYSRIPAEDWAERIAAAKQAGFNTIETACPWVVHEPRKGRFNFDGINDVRRFVTLCGEAGMKVLLRAGPFIGSGFDGGGLPTWLAEQPGIAVREANEPFLEHVSRYFRKLLGEVSELQATNGGPILLVQSEHAWLCSNEEQADDYLAEITRFIREAGITVPVTNANDLWQESPGTIDTWRGHEDLLSHLRQLRTVQENAPRLVSAFDVASMTTWASRGRARNSVEVESHTPPHVLTRLAEVLAAGAQPVIHPFHGGTNFGFLGGRLAGRSDAFVATTPFPGGAAPLGEAGARTRMYHTLRRLTTFANHFGNVFAELDPDYHPITLDLGAMAAEAGQGATDRGKSRVPGGGSGVGRGPSIVPLRGPQGQIVFVFSDGKTHHANLLLEDGIRLPVELGDQPVGWFVLDVDLQGAGRLNYANLCPFAIVDRGIVVLQGPEGAAALLSYNGAPLEARVPATNGKPHVVDHKGMTFVICNQKQIEATYFDETTVYVGVAGLDTAGRPLPHPDYAKAWIIKKDADVHHHALTADDAGASRRTSKRDGKSISLDHWEASACTAYVTGDSPRFASLEGPETLSACGAASGYGWYRIEFSSAAAKKRLCHAPQAGDRIHFYLDGRAQCVFGVGPGADGGAFDLSLAKGKLILSALADNFGRFAEGNDLHQRPGFSGHIQEVKPLKSIKPKRIEGKPVDPFKLRGYIAGRAAGQLSDTHQIAWSFSHTRKTPILVEVIGATRSGTFVLNDHPLAYYAGSTGGCVDYFLLDGKTTKAFKRGNNTLRFAPDARQDTAIDEMARAVTIYECLETLTDGATWSFAKWEPPHAGSYSPVAKAAVKSVKGLPCWWRTTVTPSADQLARDTALALETTGLSKGQAFVNGHNLGRYFTATADGKPVGPQTQLYLPLAWLKPDEPNELVLFDEHGFDPYRAAIVRLTGEVVAP